MLGGQSLEGQLGDKSSCERSWCEYGYWTSILTWHMHSAAIFTLSDAATVLS